ncbi:DNA polymerase III subunit epsilon [Citromicrobium bathyomarinum]|uniref:DNA polymerase III subunit epsilon n=1 Tax=Citromicrobium bathyomarinum TaxID=72174 RepID=UPI00315AD5D5
MREIVFDTETTGIDPRQGHRMVEIGCVELIDRMPTGKTFHAYYNPERDMPAEAEAIHGLSAQFLSEKPLFFDEVEAFLEFVGDDKLVAHNAGFDFGFLNAELERCSREAICLSRKIDTLELARRKHPGGKHSLDALCTRYGVDRSHRVFHGALLDAELLAQVYIELTGGRQIAMGLVPVADNVGEAARDDRIVPLHPSADRPVRPPRPHTASEAELMRHAAFLERIARPIWNR